MSRAEYRPDCGYAWTVVGACFVINFIVAGLSRTAGVLYIALIDAYAVSKEVATAPFTIRFCLRCMSGPVVGALGQRYGVRPIVLLGGIVSWLGGMVCAVAPDVTWITIGWGGLHGVGYGLSNIIHLLMVTRYFDKYKGIALAISLAGDCIGAFMLPSLLEFLLNIYDLKGTFLILAAISLHIVPAAMLLVPPLWEDKAKQKSTDIKAYEVNDCQNKQAPEGITNMAFEADSWVKQDLKGNVLNPCRSTLKARVVDEFSVDSSLPSTYGFYTDYNYPQTISIHGRYYNDVSFRGSQSIPFQDIDPTCVSHPNCPDSCSRNNFKCIQQCPLPVEVGNNQSMTPLTGIENNLSINDMSEIFINDVSVPLCDNLMNNRLQNSGPNHLHVHSPAIHDNTVVNVANNYSPAINLVCSNLSSKDLSILKGEERDKCSEDILSDKPVKQNVIFQLFRTNTKPIFLLISATMAVYCLLFMSVFTILIDYAIDCNIPMENGKFLIIAYSVADIFGKLGFGVVLDSNWLALPHYNGLTVGLMGLLTFVMPFWTNFVFWIVVFSACGFIQGGCSIVYPILVEHYMEKEEESVALGSLNFYAGLLMLPIPPMIGFFRDNIGTYDGVFWTTGGLCMLISCLWLLEPCLLRFKSGRKTPEIKDLPKQY